MLSTFLRLGPVPPFASTQIVTLVLHHLPRLRSTSHLLALYLRNTPLLLSSDSLLGRLATLSGDIKIFAPATSRPELAPTRGNHAHNYQSSIAATLFSPTETLAPSLANCVPRSADQSLLRCPRISDRNRILSLQATHHQNQ